MCCTLALLGLLTLGTDATAIQLVVRRHADERSGVYVLRPNQKPEEVVAYDCREVTVQTLEERPGYLAFAVLTMPEGCVDAFVSQTTGRSRHVWLDQSSRGVSVQKSGDRVRIMVGRPGHQYGYQNAVFERYAFHKGQLLCKGVSESRNDRWKILWGTF